MFSYYVFLNIILVLCHFRIYFSPNTIIYLSYVIRRFMAISVLSLPPQAKLLEGNVFRHVCWESGQEGVW